MFALHNSRFSENPFIIWKLQSKLSCYFVYLSKEGGKRIQVLTKYTHNNQFTRQEEDSFGKTKEN